MELPKDIHIPYLLLIFEILETILAIAMERSSLNDNDKLCFKVTVTAHDIPHGDGDGDGPVSLPDIWSLV